MKYTNDSNNNNNFIDKKFYKDFFTDNKRFS